MNVVNVCTRNGQQVAYEVTDNRAWVLFTGTYSECREWALNSGYAGILIGSPSVEWGN